MATTIVWFTQDLRTTDHEALTHAARRGPVVPVFVLDERAWRGWGLGGATRAWLHRSLGALERELLALGSRLVVRQGPAAAVLRDVAAESGATEVYCTRAWGPLLGDHQRQVAAELDRFGLRVRPYGGWILHDPRAVRTGGGAPYTVFTPFWKSAEPNLHVADPLPAPARLEAPATWPSSVALDALGLRPRLGWDAGFWKLFEPGQRGAQQRLESFAHQGAASYGEDRNRPDLDGSSRLSPHLCFGEISPRQAWRRIERAQAAEPAHDSSGHAHYLRELGWREFAWHVLEAYPTTLNSPLRSSWSQFPWRDSPADLQAWQRGLTGYPLVDAGMRQLWHTGWMHNRVRMVVASFLTKHLLLHWEEGARWFWDTLVDADAGNNTMGWQWAAGCGADAQPFFRIFNPITQGQKFDPHGTYVRRWVPELALLDARVIHEPWTAPALVLAAADVRLGETYPHPIVEHDAARARALALLEAQKSR